MNNSLLSGTAVDACQTSAPQVTEDYDVVIHDLTKAASLVRKIRRASPFSEEHAVLITPDFARGLLDLVDESWYRRPDPVSVAAYGRDMKKRKWIYNGGSIIISKTGWLLDGRQRLLAAVETDTSFKVGLIDGIPDEAGVTIDAGMKRTFRDALDAEGWPTPQWLPAAVKSIYQYEQGIPLFTATKHRMTHAEGLDVLKRHPDLIRSVALVDLALYECSGVLSSWRTLFTAVHYLSSRVHMDKADEMMYHLIGGENLTSQDPLLVLRNRLISSLRQRRRRPEEMSNLTVQALNLHLAGVKCDGFRLSRTFPSVAGWYSFGYRRHCQVLRA